MPFRCELLAAALLAACCLSPAACHGSADQLLAASERMGQMQRPWNYPPSNPEAEHG